MTVTPPEIQVIAWWDLSGSVADVWTVEDPVRGALDEYEIAGDIATDVSQHVRPGITITRGRNRQSDEIDVGTCQLQLANRAREFDPFNATGDFYGNIIPGKKFAVVVGGSTRYTGAVSDYDFAYARNQLSTATVPLEDSLAALARAELDAFTPAAGTASAQINEALDRPEVNFGANRNITGGVSSLGAIPVEQGTKLLAFAQKAARSDLGRFFATRDDIVTFMDRSAAIPDSVADLTVFADDGTGIPFRKVQIAYGKDVLFTRTVVSRVGGSTEITDNDTAAAVFGQISTGNTYLDLLLDSDEQSASMSDFLALANGDPEVRISAITVRVTDCDTDVQVGELFALDIGSLIAVTYTPDGVGDPIVRYCVVEGMREDIVRKFEHDITLLLGDVLQFGVWTVEDALLGALDSSPIAF